MLTKHTFNSYQNILQVDKERIEELQSLVAQNRANGNPVDKFLKELVLAYEKQIKHQIEFNKWCEEHNKWCKEHNCYPDQIQVTTPNQEQTEDVQPEDVQTTQASSIAPATNQPKFIPSSITHPFKQANQPKCQHKTTPQYTAYKPPP